MDDATGPPWWKRYWLVGALIAPLLIMGAWELLTGGGKGVPVVGAGALSVLRAEDAPEGARYQLRLRAHEEVAGTRARIEEAVTEWPDVLVFGFDGSALGSEADEEAMRAAYGALAAQVENAAGVPVIVGPTAKLPVSLVETCSTSQRSTSTTLMPCSYPEALVLRKTFARSPSMEQVPALNRTSKG